MEEDSPFSRVFVQAGDLPRTQAALPVLPVLLGVLRDGRTEVWGGKRLAQRFLQDTEMQPVRERGL